MWGFIAQLVEHRTGIAEVMGSNPVEALIFFRLLLSSSLNWKIYCDDHTSLSQINIDRLTIHTLFLRFYEALNWNVHEKSQLHYSRPSKLSFRLEKLANRTKLHMSWICQETVFYGLEICSLLILTEEYFSVPFSYLSLFFFYFNFGTRFARENYISIFILLCRTKRIIVTSFDRLLCSRKVTRFSLDKNASGRRNY